MVMTVGVLASEREKRDGATPKAWSQGGARGARRIGERIALRKTSLFSKAKKPEYAYNSGRSRIRIR